MKKALITGATGMVGSLILDQCLSTSEISHIHALGRRPLGVNHPKLSETIVCDFSDYSEQSGAFQDIDIAFFCIGVYTGQVSDAEFAKITIDYAVAFAKAIKQHSPDATLCFLSGAGADRTGKSNMAFAKYKGVAERDIAAMNLNAFYVFRPAYIYPVEKRKEPNIGYSIIRTLYPVIRLFGKNASIKSTELASAMVKAGLYGAKQEILENRNILDLYKQEA